MSVWLALKGSFNTEIPNNVVTTIPGTCLTDFPQHNVRGESL